jgi:hypothetical protein
MVRKRKRPRRPIVVGRVPGVSVPSTEKSRAHSRVAGWKHGRRATVVSPGEVREYREGQIEKLIKRSSLTIPEDLWHRAKVKALEKRMDLKELIEMALEEYLDRESKGETDER